MCLSRFILFASALGCGEQGSVSASATPAPPEPPANLESAAPSPPAPTCADAAECTIVQDACGAPWPAARDNPVVPQAPEPCPPVGYAPVEPACDITGVCVARVVESPELRVCAEDRDCVAIPWSCGGWWPVAARELEAAKALAREQASRRLCQASDPTPAPAVACLAGICVRR